MTACDDCLRRTDLIAAIAGRLRSSSSSATRAGRGARAQRRGVARGRRAAGRGRVRGMRVRRSRPRGRGVGGRARDGVPLPGRLPAAPARSRRPAGGLHVLGDPGALADADGVAVVGARRASSYGLEVARALGRGLSAARRHRRLRARARDRLGGPRGRARGARAARSACSPRAPTSPTRRAGWQLHPAVAARGAVISELPPGARAYRWCFVARNRIIAALAAATVVVQATERSGSLTTADFAAEVGRAVGAVPGPVTSRLSAGTHSLIQSGAPLIRDATDALDLLAGATGRVFAGPAPPGRPTSRRHSLTCSTRSRTAPAPSASSPRPQTTPAPPRRPRRTRTPRPRPPRLRRPLGAGRVTGSSAPRPHHDRHPGRDANVAQRATSSSPHRGPPGPRRAPQ